MKKYFKTHLGLYQVPIYNVIKPLLTNSNIKTLLILINFQLVYIYERGVILRLGKVRKSCPRGPGLQFVLPCVDEFHKVDLRVVCFDVPPQEALTKDSVSIQVDAVVYYKITDPLMSILNIANYRYSTALLALTMLRKIIGQRNLSDILSERETISHQLQEMLDNATENWGVKIDRVEMYVF